MGRVQGASLALQCPQIITARARMRPADGTPPMDKPANVFILPDPDDTNRPHSVPGDNHDASSDGDDYDAACEAMRQRNQAYLDLFQHSLEESGLKPKTIQNHLDNVDFFINTYLLHYDVQDMEAGCHAVGGFLGDFFIRKCMWSSPTSIKANAASFKKFYKCMLEHGHIAQESYDDLVAIIKEDLELWQEDCRAFDAGCNLFFDPGFFDGEGDSLGLAGLPGPAGPLGGAAGEGPALGSFGRVSTDELLRLLIEGAVDNSHSDMSHAEAVEALTLMLFYLTGWEEDAIAGPDGKPVYALRAWKSADWDALDSLREADLVACSNKAKSVTVTQAGMERAAQLLEDFGLGHLC